MSPKKDIGTIDIGEENRQKVKEIWEEGIKKYPEIKPVALELIKVIKRKAMGMPDATDEILARKQKLYEATLKVLKEEEASDQ